MSIYIGKSLPLAPHLKSIFKKNTISNFFDDWVFTFMGRDALKAISRALNLTNKNILFPCYTCVEAVSPFLDSNLTFYNIKLAGFHFSLNEISTLINIQKPSAVVVIDYFGQVDNQLPELYKICKKKDVILIEDCSHSLLSKNAGKYCDISITSLRKIFPVPDGGAFRINNQKLNINPIKFKKSIICDCAAILITLINIFHLEGLNINRRPFEKFFTLFKNSKKRNATLTKPSFFCMKMLGINDLNYIFSERRKRLFFWKRELKNLKGIKFVLPNIEKNVCPFGFPVLLETQSIREKLLHYLAQENIYFKINLQLVDLIPKKFITPILMANNSVTLPVYPELSWTEMKRISALFKAAYFNSIPNYYEK